MKLQNNEKLEEKLLTVREVAKCLAVSERTIWTWVKARKISVIKITPRCVRFHLPTVMADLRLLQIPAIGRRTRL